VVVLLLCREILDGHNPGSSAGKRRCVASVVICSHRSQEQALMQPAAPTKNSTRLTRSWVQSTKLPPTVTSKLLVTWPAWKAYEGRRCPGNRNSALTLAPCTSWLFLNVRKKNSYYFSNLVNAFNPVSMFCQFNCNV